MADVTYYISASYIGSALEDTNFLLYHTECGNSEYLVEVDGSPTITSSSFSTGFSFSISDSIEKVYLVPLSLTCPLGCGYEYSITLDQYVAPSQTPTVTPTVTPTSTPVASVTPTPTPSVTPTTPIDYKTFGLVRMDRNGEQLRFVWSVSDYGSAYQRIIYAQQLAEWIAGGNVNMSYSETSPNSAIITKDFEVYNNAKTTLMARVVRSGSPTVYFFDDGTQATTVVNNVSVSQFTSGKDNFQFTQYNP